MNQSYAALRAHALTDALPRKRISSVPPTTHLLDPADVEAAFEKLLSARGNLLSVDEVAVVLRSLITTGQTRHGHPMASVLVLLREEYNAGIGEAAKTLGIIL